MDRRLTRRLRRMTLAPSTAATARELGAYAESLGLARPSYWCLRRHIAEEVLRRAERDAAREVAARLAFTRTVVPTPEGVSAVYRKARQSRLEG
jgi:hypothetical protein